MRGCCCCTSGPLLEESEAPAEVRDYGAVFGSVACQFADGFVDAPGGLMGFDGAPCAGDGAPERMELAHCLALGTVVRDVVCHSVTDHDGVA